ncbi:MAG TPA: hypothetical protein PKC12_00790 [Thiobacillaceae bacterium]|nr:hypothetical protein [Thiobacillaceae bacterium]
MTDQKRILMVAVQKPAEALRMASGLTLLDDAVAIAVWGKLPEGPQIDEQMEALEFADVPLVELDPAADALAALARQIIDNDVVYCV